MRGRNRNDDRDVGRSQQAGAVQQGDAAQATPFLPQISGYNLHHLNGRTGVGLVFQGLDAWPALGVVADGAGKHDDRPAIGHDGPGRQPFERERLW